MILAEDLRKAVLQAAIQGKLTQQKTTDSDVDELFEKIKEEKLLLADKKNARKDRDFGDIEDSEIEFEIPDTWRWIRVGDIGVYKKGPFGSSLTKSMFVPKGPKAIKVYEQKNAIQKENAPFYRGRKVLTKLFLVPILTITLKHSVTQPHPIEFR